VTDQRVYLPVFIAILCVSTASIMVRFASAPPLVIAFYRLGFTALLGCLLMAFSGQKYPAQGLYLPRVALSGLFLALHFGFWITSLSYTSVASSVLFTNLQVVFVIILSALLLKEKIRPGAALGVAVALIGSAVIGGGDISRGRLGGDLLALASGLFFAAYLLVGRRVRDEVEIWPYTTVVSGVSALLLALAAVKSGHPLLGYAPREYALFFFMALVPGIGGHAMLNWALKYVKAPLISVSILGESVGASLLAYLLLNESLAWFQLLGGALVILGISWAVSRETTSRP